MPTTPEQAGEGRDRQRRREGGGVREVELRAVEAQVLLRVLQQEVLRAVDGLALPPQPNAVAVVPRVVGDPLLELLAAPALVLPLAAPDRGLEGTLMVLELPGAADVRLRASVFELLLRRLPRLLVALPELVERRDNLAAGNPLFIVNCAPTSAAS